MEIEPKIFFYSKYIYNSINYSHVSRYNFLKKLQLFFSHEWWITLINHSILENKYIKHTAAISYINIPNAHQSTALLYPLDKIISGAKYSIKYKIVFGY